MRTEFVDFHCHLDLYPDLKGAIAECEARQTATLAVTTTPKAFPRNRQLASNSEFVHAGLGLHPQLVSERANELSLFEQLLPETRYIGEVGLDAGPRHYRSFEQQRAVFRSILYLCAQAGDKILSVHSVRSAKHVLDLVEEYLPADRGKVVLHWFTGTMSEVRRGVQLGCYFSVNERMLSSLKGRRILCEIPSDRLLTETDGPFVKKSNLPVRPGDVQPALIEMAKIKNIDIKILQDCLLKNLRDIAPPL
ncbi:Qat anti-phage system TatD family nuclease QatD [Halomonas cibimaris]|uniref:Qat anti-phage system TatD family nuclease QatD n=1 Tax=Halomonas cibimaris TaxID=657012 RepID=UPI0031D2409E